MSTSGVPVRRRLDPRRRTGFMVLVACTTLAASLGAVLARPLAAQTAALEARAAAPFLDVPIELHENHVYVDVEVGGERHAFVLDSGASVSAIDARLARRLGLEVIDAGQIRGASGAMIAMGRTTVELRIGGLRVPGDRVVVLPLDSVIGPFEGRRVAGIVGVPLLRDHIARLDFERGRLQLWPAGRTLAALEAAAASGATLAVLPEPGLPLVAVRAELPGAGERPLRLVVDLGAKLSLILSSPFVREQGLLDAIGDAPRVTVGAGVSGETRVAVHRIPALLMDDFVVRDPIVGFGEGTQFPFDRFDGLLGTGLLKRFTVWFDLLRGRLVLEPLPAAYERETFDRSGATFRHQPGSTSTIVVHRVVPGGPAARAGLEAGDRLVALDGAAPASLASVRTRMRAPVGTGVSVLILRNGTRSYHTIVLGEIV